MFLFYFLPYRRQSVPLSKQDMIRFGCEQRQVRWSFSTGSISERGVRTRWTEMKRMQSKSIPLFILFILSILLIPLYLKLTCYPVICDARTDLFDFISTVY